MKNKISKLPNGDFSVEENTTVYGIRKYINEERSMREKLRPIHRNLFEWPPEKPMPTGEIPGPWSVTPEDPNIVILDSIIQSAHHRIAMYETLDKGLWNTIFGTDNTNEIARERELIEEFKQMKQEIIEWQTKNTTQ